MICPLCNIDFNDKKHPYLAHKIKYADFIEKYCPKYDLYTTEIIKYKTDEQYEYQDFNSKINLKKYLELTSKENGLEYLKKWMMQRKSKKNLIYAPSQFELKTLQYPSIKFFHNFYGKDSYQIICSQVGLKVRYDYNQRLIKEDRKLDFLIDTRENNVLNVPNKIIKKLDIGDYTIENSNIVIERKSLVDFCGTLSGGFDRFHKELDRAKDNNNYVIILIEEKFNNIGAIKYLPHTKHIKATSDFIFHRAREISNKYPLNCQIVCCDGRKHSIEFITTIFSLKNNIREIDFQYQVDMGEI